MNKSILFFVIFFPFVSFSQVIDDFSDGDFTTNPTWEGNTDKFIVNTNNQLQSNASETSVSSILTASEAFDNASWDCWVKIAYTTSASNYAAIYLASDRVDIGNGANAYYVKIGGTNDRVSLFSQQGSKHTEIIAGRNKRTDGNPVELRIKATRDSNGNFELYSQLASESDCFFEGSAQNTDIKRSSYFGVLFSNTSTTGKSYYFDDILVAGDKAIDTEAPTWTSIVMEEPNKLLLQFSEAVDVSNARFGVDNGIGSPISVLLSSGNSLVTLEFPQAFTSKRSA